MSVVINLKTDEQTKKQAQHIAAQMGLSLSAVLKVLIKQFIRTKRLSVDLNEIPEEKEKIWIKETDQALKKGKKYDDVDMLIADSLQ